MIFIQVQYLDPSMVLEERNDDVVIDFFDFVYDLNYEFQRSS